MIPTDLHKSKIIPLPTGRYKKVELVSLPLFASVPGGAPSHIFIRNMPNGISPLTTCVTERIRARGKRQQHGTAHWKAAISLSSARRTK